MRRDVRKGVKSEVGGIGGWRWNQVSPDIYPPSREWHPDTAKGGVEQNGIELKSIVLM